MMGYSGEVGLVQVKYYKMSEKGTEKEWLSNLDTFMNQMAQDEAFDKRNLTDVEIFWGIQIALSMRQQHLSLLEHSDDKVKQ